MRLNRFLVKLIRLAINNPQRVLGTFIQAGPQAVTVLIRYHPGFAIHNGNSPFGTGRDTVSASIAELFVDFNYFRLIFMMIVPDSLMSYIMY